jgi:phosphoglycolate phosphatase-like HAD superfamily hydrolase
VTAPTILALDFDGVICDGMHEYFESAWGAYRRLRPSAPPRPPDGLFDRFARLRPVIETGWEMPTLLHASLGGAGEAEILASWRPEPWLADLGATRETAAAALDRTRDEWIARDEPGWLAAHRFYPGLIERLRALAGGPIRLYVITTKGGRFAQKLLEGQGVALPAAQVYGKEARRPKRAILLELAAGSGGAGIWFVEDRLQTLHDVKGEPGLARTGLFLAAWGYNTPAERAAAEHDDRISLLTLDRLAGDFAGWPTAR